MTQTMTGNESMYLGLVDHPKDSTYFPFNEGREKRGLTRRHFLQTNARKRKGFWNANLH